MELNNTPFCIAETRQLDCQFGPHYYKDKPRQSSRVLIQGSRKKGCHAHITIKKCVAYPEYKVELQGKAALHTLRERRMSELKSDLVCSHTHSLLCISANRRCSHWSPYSTGSGVAGFSQRMNEKVAAKIAELVAEGITEIHEVRRLLRHYVMHDLCRESPPNPNDRAYFSIDNDLKNHVYMAKRALQLSCLDQENFYSEAELVALEEVFPSTTVYLCDFHREQAWDRWAKDHKHGLSQSEAEELLTFLRACAWAPPTDDADPTSAYKLAVNDLKQSSVWNNHDQVTDSSLFSPKELLNFLAYFICTRG